MRPPSKRIVVFGQNETFTRVVQTAVAVAPTLVPHYAAQANSPFPDLKNYGLALVLHHPPYSDGLSTVREIKRRQPDLPVIAATSDYSGDTTRLLFISGAEDVLETNADAGKIQMKTRHIRRLKFSRNQFDVRGD